MTFWSDLKRARKQSQMRPVWQICLLLPAYPIYLAARKFVDWMDSI